MASKNEEGGKTRESRVGDLEQRLRETEDRALNFQVYRFDMDPDLVIISIHTNVNDELEATWGLFATLLRDGDEILPPLAE